MATSSVHSLATDDEFSVQLANAGSKLVVVDFFAHWCGPCKVIAPKFAAMSVRFSKAVFLKVDVDKCQETAAREQVQAMPTFILYKNKVKVDFIRGADEKGLEEKISKWYSEEEEDNGDSPVKGHIDLGSMINKAACECLNQSDDHILEHALTSKGGYLESDCDEQLIIMMGFNQAVKLHSLKIHCAQDNGPKNVKLFINQPHTLDFDSAESMEPLQLLTLTPEDLQEGSLIPLKFVKMQNVSNLTIFVKDNQSGAETTQIDFISVIGSPTSQTNMSEFKRIAGKKGESH